MVDYSSRSWSDTLDRQEVLLSVLKPNVIPTKRPRPLPPVKVPAAA